MLPFMVKIQVLRKMKVLKKVKPAGTQIYMHISSIYTDNHYIIANTDYQVYRM